MMGAVLNVIIGVGLVIAGLSGQFVLRGTDSGPLLALLGGGLALFGVYQFARARK